MRDPSDPGRFSMNGKDKRAQRAQIVDDQVQRCMRRQYAVDGTARMNLFTRLEIIYALNRH